MKSLWLIVVAWGWGLGSVRATAQDQAAERAAKPLTALRTAESAPASTVAASEPSTSQADLIDALRHALEDGRGSVLLDRLNAALALPDADRIPDLQMLAARAFYAAGRVAEARRCALNVVRVTPGSLEALVLAARSARLAGDDVASVHDYLAATAAADDDLNNPAGTLAWLELGVVLAEQGYFNAAVESLGKFDEAISVTHMEHRSLPDVQRAMNQYPLGALELRVSLLKRLNRLDDRVALVQSKLGQEPDNPDLIAMQLESLRDAGRTQDALAAATKLLASPTFGEAAIEWCLEPLQSAPDVQAWVKTLAERLPAADRESVGARLVPALVSHRWPTGALAAAELLGAPLADPKVALAIASAIQMSQDASQADGAGRASLDQRAVAAIAACLRNRPKADELFSTLIDGVIRTFRDVPGLSEAAAALAKSPDGDDFASRLALGIFAGAAGDMPRAAEYFDAASQAKPECAASLVGFGQVAAARADWSTAKAHAQKVISAAPDSLAAQLLLAKAQDGLDENDQAQETLRDAIRKHAGDVRPLRMLARHYERLDNLLGAQRYYSEILNTAPTDGEAIADLLDSYLRDRKWELAEEQLKRVGDAAPSDAARRVRTALRFQNFQNGPAHVAELQKQADRFPTDLRTAMRLAEGLLVAGDVPAATKIAERVVGQQDNQRARLLLAQCLASNAEFGAAVDAILPGLKRYPNREVYIWARAVYSLYDFQLDHARDAMKIIIDRGGPLREVAREFLLQSYVDLGDVDTALKFVDEWSREKPEEWEDARLNVLSRGGRPQEAFEIVAKRLAGQADDSALKAEYVKFGVASREFQKVAEKLRGWLAEAPNNPALTETLITVLIRLRAYDEARALARDFPSDDPVKILLKHDWAARIHAAEGKYDDAIAEYDAALAATPPDTLEFRQLRGALIATLARGERFDEARQRCDEWEAGLTGAAKAEILTLRAGIASAADDDAAYSDIVETQLKFQPDDVGLFNDLGYTWIELGKNMQRAELMIRRAVAAKPWEPAYLDSLGWALYRRGDFTGARVWLDRATRLRDGKQGALLDHRGDAEFRAGDKAAAQASWQQALDVYQQRAAEDSLTRRDVRIQREVTEKLQALRAGETPHVARLAPRSATSEPTQ